MITETRSFIYEAEESRVVLHKTYEDLLSRGFNCPGGTLISLTFEIIVKDLKETISLMIGVPIDLAPQELTDEDNQYEPLIIEQLEVTVNGTLTVTFNKDLIRLNIEVGDPSKAQNRTLSSHVSKDFALKDVISLQVKDAELFTDLDENKAIDHYYLSSATNKTMEIQIQFTDLKDISPDLTLPDILDYYTILPETFIDAETGLTLHRLD